MKLKELTSIESKYKYDTEFQIKKGGKYFKVIGIRIHSDMTDGGDFVPNTMKHYKKCTDRRGKEYEFNGEVKIFLNKSNRAKNLIKKIDR